MELWCGQLAESYAVGMHIVPSSPGLTVQNEKEKDIVKGKTRRSGDDGERSVDITVIPRK